MSEQRSDDFTRDDLGFMQLAQARVLVAVAGRRLDLNDLACQELADRGLDQHGMWVGFPKARAIYERTRAAAPEVAARSDVPTNTIEMTITATMLMDEQRPAMNQREHHRTQRALVNVVRTFLWHEPVGSGSRVTNVTVSFYGHVAE